MSDDNPYQVVPSPSYGAPSQPQQTGGQGGQGGPQAFGNGLGAALSKLFGNPLQQPPQGQQQQGQGQQTNNPQPQNPYQSFGQGAGASLAAVLKRMFGQQVPGPPTSAVDANGIQNGPIAPTQTPNQPISNFNPNTTGSLY